MVEKMKSTAADAAGKAKKFSSKAGSKASGLLDAALAGSVKDSAQHIWLAGMGAFSKAQEEGTKMFESLVQEGLHLQRKTQGLAEDKISEVTGKMSAMAGSVSSKAGQNWDKLEGIFEQRTAKAMNKLGVPTAKDVDALVKRVEALAAAVAKLSQTGSVGRSAGRSADRSTGKNGPAKTSKTAKPAAAGKVAGKSASRTRAAAKGSASGAADKTATKTAAKTAAKPAAAKPAAAKSAVTDSMAPRKSARKVAVGAAKTARKPSRKVVSAAAGGPFRQ